MPAPIVKKLALEKGISVKEAEIRWDKAKKITIEQTGMTEDSGDDFWAYVVGVFKKSMGVKESKAILESATTYSIDGAKTFVELKNAFKYALGWDLLFFDDRISLTKECLNNMEVIETAYVDKNGNEIWYPFKNEIGKAIKDFGYKLQFEAIAPGLIKNTDISTYYKHPKTKKILHLGHLAETHELFYIDVSLYPGSFNSDNEAIYAIRKAAGLFKNIELKHPLSDVLDDNILESSDIEDEASKAATSPNNDLPEPTEAQKIAGTYKKAHARIAGLEIAIENPAGSERSGVDPGGKKWSIKMLDHYGYIKGTVGFDKDAVDVFINPDKDKAEIADMPVFVIDQTNKDGSFDEHKCIFGYPDKKSAKKAYLSNYEKGWSGLGSITETTMEKFKLWVMDKKKTKKKFVMESAYRDDYGGHGVLFVELPETEAIIIRNFAYSLPENDLARHPDTGEPWVEHKSHITIKYGLLPTDIKAVEAILKGVHRIMGVYGQVGVFENDEHDVLFLNTYSADLISLNHEASRMLPVIESEYKYTPHVTIAYLKKGTGEKYNGMRFFSGINFLFNQIQYSDKQGNSFPLNLKES